MHLYTNFIMKHKKLIISIFIIAAIISSILAKFVNVNYDFSDYLPDESKSTKSISIMYDEFGQAIPNLRVLLHNISISEALKVKSEISSINGVDQVQWLDDIINIYQPIETIPHDILDTWYKNNSPLFLLTINNGYEKEVINQIRNIIGEDNSMAGAALDSVIVPTNTEKEVKNIMFIVIPIILAILLLTTTSWFEPVLFLFTIAIAILLNSGSNLILGTISFVTNAAGSLLQIAVSMDYSIFLLHRFADNRKEGMDVESAMKLALKQSMSSILSSGLTTITGFAALILMRFKIGPDMGWVMAKAILLSLICVLCLLPVLTVTTYKIIDLSTHKSFVPRFDKFAKFIYKMRIPSIVIFIILIIPTLLASRNNTYLYGASKIYNTAETQLGRDIISIEEIYGASNQVIIMVPKGNNEKEVSLNEDLKNIDGVTSIISYVNTVNESIPPEFLPQNLISNLYSSNYSRFIITLNTNEEMEDCFTLINEIKNIATKYYGDSYYFAGDLVSTDDLRITITSDDLKVNLLAIAFVFMILLINFKSITIPIILTLVIETSIWINLSIPYFSDTKLYYIGYLIISSVQLGATIDYAILLCERYKEYRKDFNKKPAIIETIKSCTISIFTSASILCLAGTTLGLISTNGVLSQLGILLGRGAALSFILVLFVLPILLITFDKFIKK